MTSEQSGGPNRQAARHPVRVVSLRTGLSAHALRAWERRYGAVAPDRSDGGQRLYSDADIERLRHLKTLTDHGYAIGQLAELPDGELLRLLREAPEVPPADAAPGAAAGSAAMPPGDGASGVRAAVMRAITEFDATRLRHELMSGTVALGVPRFLEEVLSPVLFEIGEQWRRGALGIAHEHLATVQVRQVLGWIRETAERSGPAPTVVVSTPAGQAHEGGALLVAAAAAAEGWHVAYLGPNLPAQEIADAARRSRARVVALSIIHPSNDPRLPAELEALGAALPPGARLLVGGAAAPAYAAAIASAGGEIILDLGAARAALQRIAGAADPAGVPS